jgi:23S rRNA (cytosine1962-C5)-methyltransferase
MRRGGRCWLAAFAGAFPAHSPALKGLSALPARVPAQPPRTSIGGHTRFVVDDTLALLPKLATRGERFDAIILDPPTFSRSANGRRWQAEFDYEELINGALDVAAPKCAVLLSTNCTKLDVMALEKMARLCIKTKKRAADYLKLGTPVDFPPGHGASALWMMVR